MKYLIEDRHSKECEFYGTEQSLMEKIRHTPKNYLASNVTIYELKDVTAEICGVGKCDT